MSVLSADYQKALDEIERMKGQLRAVISERDGPKGYAETVKNLRGENARLRSDRDALLCVCSQAGKELTSRANQLLQAAALQPPAGIEGGAG